MKWLVCVTLLVGVASVASWKLHPGNQRVQGDSSLSPTTGPALREIQGIGYVEPVSEVRQLMMRTGGVIQRCHVKAGDRVRKGAILLELDDATQRAEVQVARKHLELAQAEAHHVQAGINPYRLKVAEQTVERLREKLRHCRLEAERFKKMIVARSASQQEYDAVETQRRQTEVELKEHEAELEHLRHHVTPEHRALLEAKVRHARTNLELAEERLRETRLVAPFDGTVLKLLKREGEGVRMFEPEPVVLFGDLARVRVRAEVDERFVQHPAVGQAAVIYGRNLVAKTYRGYVVQVEPVMGEKTVFTRASSERKDLDVLQVLIDMGPDFRAPVGLQVDVKIQAQIEHTEGSGQ